MVPVAGILRVVRVIRVGYIDELIGGIEPQGLIQRMGPARGKAHAFPRYPVEKLLAIDQFAVQRIVPGIFGVQAPAAALAGARGGEAQEAVIGVQAVLVEAPQIEAGDPCNAAQLRGAGEGELGEQGRLPDGQFVAGAQTVVVVIAHPYGDLRVQGPLSGLDSGTGRQCGRQRKAGRTIR